MKEIFDWMREQIENKCNYEPVDYDYCDMACSGEQGFIAREDVLDAINEAEAKWEAECCEWKYDKGSDISYPHYATTCGNSVKNICSGHTYCGYCGKPIKISEVE